MMKVVLDIIAWAVVVAFFCLIVFFIVYLYQTFSAFRFLTASIGAVATVDWAFERAFKVGDT